MLKIKLSAILLLFSLSLYLVFLIQSRPEVKGIKTPEVPNFVAAVLPHHLLAKSLIDDFISRLNYTPQKIYVIGPNHFEIGQAPIITTNNSESTNLLKTGLVRVDNQIVKGEHSITVFQDKLANTFPNTPVIPLVISARITLKDIDKTANYLFSNSPNGTLIICSTDFSHYLLLSEAEARDQKTLDLISSKSYQKIFTLGNEYIDSPKSLLILLKTLDLTKYNHMSILNHTNSAVLLQNLTLPSTTSYFELAFN